MPEGPEMRRAADELAAVLSRRKAQAVAFGLPALRENDALLTNRRIVTSVYCRGKALLIEFSGGHTVFTHNQLYGKWYIKPRGRRPKTNRQLRLRIDTLEHSALLYSASNISVLDAAGLESAAVPRKPWTRSARPRCRAALINRRLKRPALRVALARGAVPRPVVFSRYRQLSAQRDSVRRAHLAAAPAVRFGRGRKTAETCTPVAGDNAPFLPHRGFTNAPKFVNPLRNVPVYLVERYRFFVFGRDGKPCYECGTKSVALNCPGAESTTATDARTTNRAHRASAQPLFSEANASSARCRVALRSTTG